VWVGGCWGVVGGWGEGWSFYEALIWLSRCTHLKKTYSSPLRYTPCLIHSLSLWKQEKTKHEYRKFFGSSTPWTTDQGGLDPLPDPFVGEEQRQGKGDNASAPARLWRTPQRTGAGRQHGRRSAAGWKRVMHDLGEQTWFSGARAATTWGTRCGAAVAWWGRSASCLRRYTSRIRLWWLTLDWDYEDQDGRQMTAPLALSPMRHWSNDDVLAASDGPARHSAVGEALGEALGDSRLVNCRHAKRMILLFHGLDDVKNLWSCLSSCGKTVKWVSWAARPLTSQPS
jgi:hypothetical protein